MRRILQTLGIEPTEIRPVAKRDNDVYRVRTADGVYALRVHRPGVTKGEVEEELRWLAHLAPRLPGRVPAPAAPVVEQDGRVASLLTWVSGRVPKKPSPALAKGLGEALAAVHAASEGFAPGSRRAWDGEGHFGEALLFNLKSLRPIAPPEDLDLFFRRAKAVQEAFRELASEPRTMLHGDFFPMNVLHQRGRLAIIDFANGGPGPRVYDLGVALRHGWPDGRERILEAYQRSCPLTERERALLPHMIQARILQMAAYAAERIRQPGGSYDPPKLVVWAAQNLRDAGELD